MKAFIAALVCASASAFEAMDKFDHFAQKETNGFSEIQMEVDGVSKTYYAAAAFSSGGGSDYHLPSNGRGYIHETDSLDLSNPQYFTPNLLGGKVEYDIDLSNHECGCIAAFYLVSMPGKHEDGSLWMDTDGWGYCDAN